MVRVFLVLELAVLWYLKEETIEEVWISALMSLN